jgi:hypothetical protein
MQLFQCFNLEKMLKTRQKWQKSNEKLHVLEHFWQELSVYKYNEIFSIHPRKVVKIRAGLV